LVRPALAVSAGPLEAHSFEVLVGTEPSLEPDPAYQAVDSCEVLRAKWIARNLPVCIAEYPS
jgi:hypothetical protein